MHITVIFKEKNEIQLPST